MNSTAFPSVAYYARTPHAPAPAGHPFASVSWLVARHPVLLQLAHRVPGAVDDDGDVLPWVLADAFTDLDTHHDGWAAYQGDRPAPRQHRGEPDHTYDTRYDAWAAAGPQPTEQAEALSVMSRTEKARLRLLAAFSDQQPVAFQVGMLDGFDAAGHDLITDWLTTIHAYLGR